MNIHKNARLTPQGRLLLVERITEAGWSVVPTAQAAGISVRQSYRWLARYRAEGAAGLGDRSSAPHRCQHRTPGDRVGEIERLRRQRMSGPQIARQLGMPVSTVGGVLRRLRLNRLAVLDEKPAVVRYERERPGELIHLDTKKLGCIAGVGHRITGRRPGKVNRHHGIGWEALHVCIDDASLCQFPGTLCCTDAVAAPLQHRAAARRSGTMPASNPAQIPVAWFDRRDRCFVPTCRR